MSPAPDRRVAAGEADELMAWAEEILPNLLRSLAARVGGTTDATIRRGATPPFRGGFIHYTAAGRVSLRMWIHVSPAGAGGSVPGEPDAVYLQPDEGGKAGWRLRANFAEGFQSGADIAGHDTWRTWVPAETVRAAGPPEAQVAFLTERFAEALTAAGLLEPM
jgi:hypothetical protein